MAAKYKLTYFQITGRGEPIRFLLAYGQLEFEDVRIPWQEWTKVKPEMPFGKLPILEIDGKVCHQTMAICRYLAKKLNLAGRNDWESLQIDIVVDTLIDFGGEIAKYYYDPNETARGEKYEVLRKDTIPFFMSRFDKIVSQNEGYLVSGQLSWADLTFISLVDYLCKLVDFNMYKDYPNLTCLKEKVYNIPQIKAWIEKRPEEILYTFKK